MVFNYPGMGLAFYNAALNVDYQVLLGFTLLATLATIIGNLLADLGTRPSTRGWGTTDGYHAGRASTRGRHRAHTRENARGHRDGAGGRETAQRIKLRQPPLSLRGLSRGVPMRANEVQPVDPVRYGTYACLVVPPGARLAAAGLPVAELADRLGLRNEFDPGADHPPDAISFLRGTGSTPGDIADFSLLHADAVVHVASASAALVAEFFAEFTRLLDPAITARILNGVVRPMTYTGMAMFNFAYAHRVLQQPASVMPNAFLIPMSKTLAWWKKDWMERHTYFLPRYDDSGRRLAEGHALAAAAGIPCIMRRFYKNATEQAPPGAYDFITYFECADENIPTFYEVCAALRDTARNPEWRFVREGPTWRGQRVATWAELFG